MICQRCGNQRKRVANPSKLAKAKYGRDVCARCAREVEAHRVEMEEWRAAREPKREGEGG